MYCRRNQQTRRREKLACRCEATRNVPTISVIEETLFVAGGSWRNTRPAIGRAVNMDPTGCKLLLAEECI